MSAIEVSKIGGSQAEFMEVFELLIALHKEGGYAELDEEKTVAAAYTAIADGMALVARDAARTAVGTLGLAEYDWWYASDTYLGDKWLYVVPGARGQGVCEALLREARKIADARDKMLFITVTSPDRKVRRSRLSETAQLAGYVPLGHMMRLR